MDRCSEPRNFDHISLSGITSVVKVMKAVASIELDLPIAADVTAVECTGPEVRSGAGDQASRSGAILRPQLSFRECGPTGKGSDH